jgi:aspartyl-tRNA(Asn)/glutamyl-tRNA(Gln) amidotransferase subunit C
MAQVSEVLASAGQAPSEKQSVLRDDEVRPCLDRAAVMASAPESDSVFFKVPRVIER